VKRLPFSILLLPLLASACSEDEPLRLGVVMESEGQRGAELAAEEINLRGGIDGRLLELRSIYDAAENSARVAIEAAELLASDPTVLAVVGHPNSAATLAASQVYNSRGLVHVSPISTAPMVSQAGPYTFRTIPSDLRQAAFLADLVRSEAGERRPALIYVNDDYGRGLYQELRRRLVEGGTPPVYEGVYGEADKAPRLEVLARALSDSPANGVVWIGRSQALGHFAAALREMSPTVPVLASEAVEAGRVYRNEDGVYTGVRFVRFLDPAAPGPVQELRERYLERFGEEITGTAVLTYDTVLLLAEALQAGARDRRGIRDYLMSLGRQRPEFQGIMGSISFDENGDLDRAYLLAEVTPDGVKHVATPRGP
jgi:branched-chain amino acid transport system substrate-binding protein